MRVDELRERKRYLGYSNEKIAEISGVPLSTVQKIFAGVTQRPRYDTLAALERALDDIRVGEAAFQYGIDKKQGEYTIEDYERLPEDAGVEMIDGALYDMTGPMVVHQSLATALWSLLKEHIRENNGQCIAMLAPVDAHLRECDNKTIVQPDVFVVCDRSKFTQKRIEGAPDLVIEIISPSTRRKDFTIKLCKYEEAGVREYWLVDPERRNVVVYVLEEDILPRIYTFSDKIPVAIFAGKCVIDMENVSQELQFFFDLE